MNVLAKVLPIVVVLSCGVAAAEPWHADLGGSLGLDVSNGGMNLGADLSLHGNIYFRGLHDDGVTPYGALAFYQRLTELDFELDVHSPTAEAHGYASALIFPWRNTAFIVASNLEQSNPGFPLSFTSFDLGALTYFREDLEGELWLRTGVGAPPHSDVINPGYNPQFLGTFFEERLHAGLNGFLDHRHLRLSGSVEGAMLFQHSDDFGGQLSGSEVVGNFSATVYAGRSVSFTLGLFEHHLQAGNDAVAVTSTGWAQDRDGHIDTFGANANIRWFVTRGFYLQLLGLMEHEIQTAPPYDIEQPLGMPNFTISGYTAVRNAGSVQLGAGGRF